MGGSRWGPHPIYNCKCNKNKHEEVSSEAEAETDRQETSKNRANAEAKRAGQHVEKGEPFRQVGSIFVAS